MWSHALSRVLGASLRLVSLFQRLCLGASIGKFLTGTLWVRNDWLLANSRNLGTQIIYAQPRWENVSATRLHVRNLLGTSIISYVTIYQSEGRNGLLQSLGAWMEWGWACLPRPSSNSCLQNFDWFSVYRKHNCIRICEVRECGRCRR